MKTTIQATISGFGGKACTVYSMYDSDTLVLAVGLEGQYTKERRSKDVVVITNEDIDRDRVFSVEHIQKAVTAYYELKNGVAIDGFGSRLIFAERAARANPDTAIERDGFDLSGPKYRISDIMTNAQAATLATCLYAASSDRLHRAVSFLVDGNSMDISDQQQFNAYEVRTI